MAKSKIINIQDYPIAVVSHNNEDYISLTDMARSQLGDIIIIKWLSLKNTINTSVNGKRCIIRFLIIPNSVQLKIHQAEIILCYLLKIG